MPKIFFPKGGSAEALRRLGGPDVEAEARKLRMNGEQKTWVLSVAVVAIMLSWVAWLVQQYNVEAARAAPSASETLACVDSCARSCAAELRP